MDEKEEDDFTPSEEYEEKAVEALPDSPEAAGVYATLALAATVREATYALADLLAYDGDEDDEDGEDDGETT